MTPDTLALGGLTVAEAAARLARDGPNRLVPETHRHRLRRLIGPFSDPMVLLLLVAAPTYLAIGETTDAVVALVALGPIAAVGWLLESRAERTLEHLRRRTTPTTRTLRGGIEIDIPAEDLVVGDVVSIREGDIVPADAAVIDVTQLLVDESSLTGESLPVEKGADGPPDTSAAWAGTTVVSGRALVRITATGAATRYAGIGALVAEARPQSTPLQRALGKLVGALAVLAVVFCAAVIAAELLNGNGWGDAIIAGVSLAIAAIPEEFSMVYTLYLALGAWRLAQQRALVRRLPSVETLGSTTVICTDKTGTLTEGRLAVRAIWTPEEPRPGASGKAETELLATAVLACEPDPFDPLDVAIVDYARQHGIDIGTLHAGSLVADWPFDPAGKYLTHIWLHHPDPDCHTAAKGSVEGILGCTSAPPALRAEIMAANARFAADGMRVIAVAGTSGVPPTGNRRDDEAGLRFLGLVAFDDPIRDGVRDALAQCRNAGIRVVMITGDHPATAHAVAESLGLPHEAAGQDVIATGDDLDGPDSRVDELAHTANVYARTGPEQKHRLVQALRQQGHVVAMTGDGINDAPALREADIGVAMGERGTEVARDAVPVLLDDNFATIVAAVRDGRRIFDNLTRAFAYLIAFHPPLLLAALVIPLLDRPLLLLPIHLVVLELLLHPIVSLVFQADPAEPDAMSRPPRPVGDALRLRALWRPYAVGIVLAAAIIAEYLLALAAGWPTTEARALGFATLLASQPPLLLTMRSPDEPLWRPGRPWTPTLIVATAVILTATLAVVYVPAIADLLQLTPFAPAAWGIVVAVATTATLWAEPLKTQGSTRQRSSQASTSSGSKRSSRPILR